MIQDLAWTMDPYLIGVFGVQQDLQVGHLKKKCRQAVGQAAKSAGLWSLKMP
jgi:hypothetical protein